MTSGRSQKPADEPDRPDRAERRQAANARARAVERAARAVLRDGRIARRTRRGEVLISTVELIDVDGVEHIEARTPDDTQSGETHFRIFNPPLGVMQPDGTVTEDPIGALAEVLAQFGGAQRAKRRRTR